jgi:solute carrier family 13 (sodium-dependent dicarboxylate transporter), member 2/3/5
MSVAAAQENARVGAGRRALVPLGLALLAAALLLDPPGSLAPPAWRCAAIAAVMALWWVSEALPLPVTALLPLAAFPLLGLGSFEATTTAYAHPLVMLFFGGFVVGIAIERHGLHLRLARAMLRVAGDSVRARLGGLMLATALLSMWLNNTSTTLAMLPVALALVPAQGGNNAATARTLLLGVAYAATIGGLATLVGTAPNALLAGYLAQVHGVQVGFAQWLVVGVPVSAVLLVAAWAWLGRPLRGSALPVLAAPAAGTRLDAPQRRVAAVFGLLVLAWLTRPLLARALPELTDAGLAMLAAFALFVLPDGRDPRAGAKHPGRGRTLLTWEDLAALPWGVLILFGGGLALGGAMETSGLAAAIGEALQPALAWPALLALAAVVVTLIVLTEFASNTAIAAAFLPVVGALAAASGAPVALLAVPAGLATSCGFMLPAGTPPNAIVFAGGHVTAAQMARAGIVLNLLAAAVLALLVPPLVRLAGLTG